MATRTRWLGRRARHFLRWSGLAFVAGRPRQTGNVRGAMPTARRGHAKPARHGVAEPPFAAIEVRGDLRSLEIWKKLSAFSRQLRDNGRSRSLCALFVTFVSSWCFPSGATVRDRTHEGYVRSSDRADLEITNDSTTAAHNTRTNCRRKSSSHRGAQIANACRAKSWRPSAQGF